MMSFIETCSEADGRSLGVGGAELMMGAANQAERDGLTGQQAGTKHHLALVVVVLS